MAEVEAICERFNLDPARVLREPDGYSDGSIVAVLPMAHREAL